MKVQNNLSVSYKAPIKNYKAKYTIEFFHRKKIASYCLWAIYVKVDGHYPKIPQGYGQTDTLEQAHLAITDWCQAQGIVFNEMRSEMTSWRLVKDLLEGKNGAEYFAEQIKRRRNKKDILAISNEIKELVLPLHGKLITTSLIVADKFEKRHKNVLQAIDNLPKDEFHRLNFQPRDYVDERGKTQPMYEMTWKGFSMLAMGFTGSKAYIWKEKFLNAFEAMGNEIDRLHKQTANQDWKFVRDETKLGFKWMTENLKESREANGKETKAHHYQNEARMINAVLSNQFAGLDRNSLSTNELRLMGDLQRYNARLIAQDLTYQLRKTKLHDYFILKLEGHQKPVTKIANLNNNALEDK